MPGRRKLLLAVLGLGLGAGIAGAQAASAPAPGSPEPAPAAVPSSEPAIERDGAAAAVDSPLPDTAETRTIEDQPAPATPVAAAAPDADLLCLAKIVHHEAANQSRRGQVAVAQVVMNRLASPRFPKTICAIALQRGQFFNVHAYNPPRDSRWRLALEIAREARDAAGPRVVGDAVFFHSVSVRPAFFRNRQRTAQIGAHIFYR